MINYTILPNKTKARQDVFQMLAGVGRFPNPTDPGGIAFMTQLGGFVAGVVGVWLFKRPERERVEWWGV